MKQNVFIRIMPSPDLLHIGLGALAGRRGWIVEDLTSSDRRIKGYMVHLAETYENEFLWFIPEEAVCYE